MLEQPFAIEGNTLLADFKFNIFYYEQINIYTNRGVTLVI